MKVAATLAVSVLLVSSGACKVASAELRPKIQPIIPVMNGAWFNDAIYPNGLAASPSYQAGLFSKALKNFNKQTDVKHSILRVYSHGGTIQLYCQGAEGSWPYVACAKDNVTVSYGESSQASTSSYKQKFSFIHQLTVNFVNLERRRVTDNDDDDDAPAPKLPQIQMSAEIVPVIAGQLNDLNLNALDKSSDLAEIVAEKVAEVYCHDPKVSGVQMNLAPFNINHAGQFALYKNLNHFFGEANNQCVDQLHPNGRYFSIVGLPGKFGEKGKFTSFKNRTWKKIKKVLGERGYFVVQAYDLGPKSQGEHNDAKHYMAYLKDELKAIRVASKKFGIKYSIALPVVASSKEYKSRYLYQFGGKNTLQAKYRGGQVRYVKLALTVIKKYRMQQDSNFVGLDYKGWSKTMSYLPETNQLFLPKKVSKNMIALLHGVKRKNKNA